LQELNLALSQNARVPCQVARLGINGSQAHTQSGILGSFFKNSMYQKLITGVNILLNKNQVKKKNKPPAAMFTALTDKIFYE